MRTWPTPEVGELHGLARRLNARVGKHVEAARLARLARLDGDTRLYELHTTAAREVLGAYYEVEAQLLKAIEEAPR